MKDHNKKSDFDTRAIHVGRNPATQGGMVNPPVYHGSTIVYSTVAELEFAKENYAKKNQLIYGRFGNLSTFALEDAMADLENGYGSLTVSSGLAAVTTAILTFCEQGKHILMVDTVYGPTRYFCDLHLTKMGVEVEYYDPMIGSDIEKLIKPNTSLIFLEAPGSVTFEVQDVPAITAVAKKHNITTAIDNSWATPLFFKPLDHGVNISVTAATKYIVGHADALLGIIATDTEENFHKVKQSRDLLGHSLAPDDVFLGLRGLRTLGIRLRQHEQQALTLANQLKDHPEVLTVLHPAFETCPGHEFWKRDFTGASGLFSILVKPRSKDALANMLDNMELFSMGFSWGGFESLIIPQDASKSRTATHWEQEGQLLRIHAGFEDIDDLLKDLLAGLDRYETT